MAAKNYHRLWERNNLDSPHLAIYYPLSDTPSASLCVDNTCQRFIDLTDQTPGGAKAIATQRFEPGTQCILKIHSPTDRSWSYYPAEVKWSAPSPSEPQCYLTGFEFSRHVPIHWPPQEKTEAKQFFRVRKVQIQP